MIGITRTSTPDHEYHEQLRHFIQSSEGKEPDKMRALVIEFLPIFIAKITEDIRISIDTRYKGHLELRKIAARTNLHGESRRARKQREKIIKLLKHNESLSERVKDQIEHFESMRVAFNISLSEVEGVYGSLSEDSSLYSLFPQLYSDNA